MSEHMLAVESIADSDLSLMLSIRYFEQELLALFAREQINGTTHTCLGQEYIPVTINDLLIAEDFLLSNHRGHGHYIARFGDPQGLLAEITGRVGAICNGVGGSQHIYRSGYLSTGVQGENVPVAAGIALHLKRTHAHALALVYIGDGTWGEGSVYEALNIVQLWGLPLVVVVENNGIAQSTPIERNMAGTIEGRARAFGVAYAAVHGTDVMAIRRTLTPYFQAVRATRQPLIVEFKTYRQGPHSKGDDTRSPQALAALQQFDWYQRYQQAFPEQFQRLATDARASITTLVEQVLTQPLADWEELCLHLNG